MAKENMATTCCMVSRRLTHLKRQRAPFAVVMRPSGESSAMAWSLLSSSSSPSLCPPSLSSLTAEPTPKHAESPPLRRLERRLPLLRMLMDHLHHHQQQQLQQLLRRRLQSSSIARCVTWRSNCFTTSVEGPFFGGCSGLQPQPIVSSAPTTISRKDIDAASFSSSNHRTPGADRRTSSRCSHIRE